MKDVIDGFIRDHLMIHLVLIALSTAAILGAMAIDFVFGVKKAKQRNEARTSTGFKKTTTKAQKYFSPFIVLCFMDLISSIIIPFPVFSMLWAGYCIFCEYVSVREKSWQKEEIRKAEKTVRAVIENKEDIAKAIVDIMFNKEGQKHEND